METFIWDQHFTTGLASVDAQHHQLVRLINRLGETLIGGAAGGAGAEADALPAAFAQLADYARYHFADEERLALEAGVSARHRELHHRHHLEFVEQVSAMWNARASMSRPAEALHDFLRSWLGFHILGEDQAMARQIAMIGQGIPAEEACDIELAREDNATSALLQSISGLYHVLAQQNLDLAAANLQLETRVAERTQELAQANQRLQVLSNSDALLGIANRRYFDRRLDEEWRRAAREEQPLALLMIDVDHFKRYNDHYGHPAGDRCLQAVAQAAGSPAVLKRPGDLLARYGGEELAAILPHTTEAGALVVAQDMLRAIAALRLPHADSPVAGEVTVSIGAASLRPQAGGDALTLLDAADRALYEAKAGGRNRVVGAAPAQAQA